MPPAPMAASSTMKDSVYRVRRRQRCLRLRSFLRVLRNSACRSARDLAASSLSVVPGSWGSSGVKDQKVPGREVRYPSQVHFELPDELAEPRDSVRRLAQDKVKPR